MASDRPSSDIVFSVKPNAQTATNDASTETGSAKPGDDRRAPGVEEQKDDEHGQRRAFDQRVLDVAHRGGDTHAAVLHDAQGHTRRQRRD